MEMDSILKKINGFCTEIKIDDLNIHSNDYIRDFNKGKSFEFSKWAPLTKYTNDSFKQDFVSYNNVLLACKNTHISEEPPILEYENNIPIGIQSENWIFVFSAETVITGEDVSIIVDEEMSDISTNPVQNKTIKKYIDTLFSSIDFSFLLKDFSDDFNNDFAI